MDTKVDKDDLLAQVRKNRALHEEQYKEAMKIYKQEIIQDLEKKLKRARAGKLVNHYIKIDMPVNYLGDYDEAIEMLEWSTTETIDLDKKSFQQLVKDKWEWEHLYAINTLSKFS